MKKLFLWASVILVCYFAADVARVPTTALLGAKLSAGTTHHLSMTR